MNEERLRKRYEREKKARLESERILEDKSRELFERNEELRKLSESLEKLVEERTRDLVEARDQALDAAKAKSQFMANMSHEIRTPLNGVIGILNMFNDKVLDADHIKLLATAKNSGWLLLEIVNDILDFSKLDAGQLALHEEAINLKQLLQESIPPLRLNATNKGVQLAEHLPDTFPTKIKGDGLRIKQIITNLLSNAIKFTSEGQVTLNIEQIDRQYKIIVTDSGIGMSEEQVGRIFGAFGQADGSITREYGGTGLGLTITQSLVHMMGGSIQVKSEIGNGSSFIITLPLLEIEDDQCEETLSEFSDQTQFEDASVLLTEDNEVNQVVATHLLESANLNVTLAENGQIALDLCRSQHFDLVLMDIQMPVMDGLQASKEIRNLTNEMKDVPIVAMTAHATEEHRRDSFQAGMNEHITKPIEPIILYKTLGRYLDVKPGEPAEHPKPESIGHVKSYNFLGIHDALNRLGGNQDLYSRLIGNFFNTHSKLNETLQSYFDTDKFNDAQSLLHTIKGSAANIGAEKLSRAAASIESKLKNGKRSELKELSYFLEDTWKKTKSDMQDYLRTREFGEQDKPSLSKTAVSLKLKLLTKHLAQDISQAEDIINDLRNSKVDDRFHQIIESLGNEIDVFNIAGAQDKLNTFLEKN